MTNKNAQRAPGPANADQAALKLEEFLPYRLNVCASLVSQALSRIYAERYKIGVPEWRVLVTLGQFGMMTAKAIGIHSHMHKTKVSRAVALLERRKLVARRANRADLREAFLSLTPAGRDIYSELAPIAHRFRQPVAGDSRCGRPRRARPRAEEADRAFGAARPRYRQRWRPKIDLPPTSSRVTSVKLYSYFRSSAAYRVRIALNLKGMPYEMVSIHLTKDGGQQRKPEFRAINPQMRVPALELPSGEVLTQSLAIIEYLDDIHPEPPLLPADALARAKVRAIAQMVACDIHPLNNLIALQYLKRTLKHEQPEIDAWYHHWVIDGFTAIEAMIAPAPYACGAQVTLADICLVPQVSNARRLKVPLDKFPKIVAADAACLKLPAFDKARPENQPDAE